MSNLSGGVLLACMNTNGLMNVSLLCPLIKSTKFLRVQVKGSCAYNRAQCVRKNLTTKIILKST